MHLVLSLIFVDEGHEVEGALPNKDDLAIFDTSIGTIFFLDDATLPDIHGLKEVVSADLDLPFPISLERDNRIVIET